MTSPSENAGFTLLEILMAVALLSVISVVSIDVISDTLNENRFQDTVSKLQQIANAMVGDASLKENGARTSFGFLGDIGALPTAGQGIAALVTNPGLPAWAVNAGVRFGLGWNGPYLQSGNSGTDYTKDAWGNALVYDPAASPPTLTSYGADRAAGGTGFNQDIVVTLPAGMTTATSVSGYVTQHYSAYSGNVDVELNAPDGSGALARTLYTVAAPTGYFSFANVPFGTRSITAYIGTKAAPTQTLGPVLITIDRPNYTVPPNLLEMSP